MNNGGSTVYALLTSFDFDHLNTKAPALLVERLDNLNVTDGFPIIVF